MPLCMGDKDHSDSRPFNKLAERHDTSDSETQSLLSARKATSLQTEVEVELKNVEGFWSRGSKPYIQVRLYAVCCAGAPPLMMRMPHGGSTCSWAPQTPMCLLDHLLQLLASVIQAGLLAAHVTCLSRSYAFSWQWVPHWRV